MNYTEHVSASETFLLAEDILRESGMGMAAAESVWGAAVQAIEAANHSGGAARHVHSNSRNMREVIDRLGGKYDLFDEVNGGYTDAKNVPHNHFYTGRLSGQELNLSLARGRAFVNLMLELGSRERGGE